MVEHSQLNSGDEGWERWSKVGEWEGGKVI
jgi:hypothetical protein